MRLIFCLFYIFFYIAMRWLFNILRHLKWPKTFRIFGQHNLLLHIECKWMKKIMQINDESEDVKEKKTDTYAFKERTPVDKWRTISIIFAHLNIHFILNMLIQTSLLFHLFFWKECKEDYPRFIFLYTLLSIT